MHPNGWVYKRDTMAEKLAQGRILFGPDEKTRPTYKRYLHETTNQVIPLIIQKDRRAASKALAGAIGPNKFDYPKDVDVLATWINTVTMRKPDAVVLDFFGGSGSTLHAVMNLNALDGGSRQCILITNNEVSETSAAKLRREGHSPGDDAWEAQGIFESATRPRITSAVTGERRDGSPATVLSENITFLSLEYLDPDDVRRGRSFSDVAYLLWLKAGAIGPCIETHKSPWSLPPDARYGALFDVGAWSAFADAVEKHSEPISLAYIVTDSTSAFAQARKALPPNVKPVHLYENYLTTFTINGLVL
jgi:adenine-specific DNA-methyltransferase